MKDDSRNNSVKTDSQSYYVNTKHKCKKSLKYARIKVSSDKAVECMDRTENNRCAPHCTPDSE